MFQYAFGLSLANKNNCDLYLDNTICGKDGHDYTARRYELNIFNNIPQIAGAKLIGTFLQPGKPQRMLRKIGVNIKSVYLETSLRFNKDVYDVKPPAYFDGFWQSEKYFNIDLIRSSLIFGQNFNSETSRIANQIMQQAAPVSIHIRRGDYVTSKTTNELHGLCAIGYYQKAIALINNQVPDAHFYIFSDDTEWVSQSLLPGLKNARVVHHNQGADSWQDMALMSMCKHHIIANSSFSWWGAWLNPDKKKTVIAPEKWFARPSAYFDDTDIVPSGWIKLPND